MVTVASVSEGESAGLPASVATGGERTIAHLDLDAFYVSVELAERPELVGLPVIVAGSGPRAVVTTASYEARRHGVGSAMPAAKALRLCPDAVVIPPDRERYARASRSVMDLIHHHIETVEQVGLDEAYVDLSGMAAPVAAMRTVVRDIHAETGLHGSVGIGPNRLVAKVASDAEKPRGFVVLTKAQARHRFADESCGLLPGVGPKTAERLRVMGIRTIRELAAADPSTLAGVFGERQGPALVQRAHFNDETPVKPVRDAVSESRETTFDVDVADPAELRRRLDMLVGELCAALRRHGHSGRTIGIKIRYSDFETHTKARTLQAATADPLTVGRVAGELLDGFAPERAVRLIGVRVSGFAAARDGQLQLALPFA